MIHQLRCVLATLLLLSVALSSCAAAAEELGSLQLPRSLYKSIAGGWNVDLYSPCGSHASGVVTFANETALLRWAEQGVDLAITPFEDSKAMDLRGLQPFMAREVSADAVRYRICERLENTMNTPGRPGFGSAMGSTHLYDFAGTFERGDADPCQAAARPVHIRVMGSPLVTSLYTSDQKGQVKYMEITVDSKYLGDAACATTSTDDSVAVPRDGTTTGRGRRKRGMARQGARQTTASSSPDSVADVSVRSGLLVVRFAMRSPPPKTTLQRAYPVIMFVCMFIVMRIVYGYSFAKAAKS